MQTQPSPDSPTPPPSKDALRSRRYWMGIWIFGLMLMVGLVLMVIPTVLRQRREAIHTEAVGFCRQLGLCLFEFEQEYGKFPDASTIAEVTTKSGSLLPLGTKTSNDYFRQLIASGISQSERMFYAEIAWPREPDGLMDPTHALEKGECGFSYLMGLLSKGDQSRPILVTPLIPGTDRFDPKPFGGKAVLLMMDNTVTSLSIEKDGHVLLNGKNILDPTHPIWAGKPPVIVWPDL